MFSKFASGYVIDRWMTVDLTHVFAWTKFQIHSSDKKLLDRIG